MNGYICMCSWFNENYFGHLSFLGNNLSYNHALEGGRSLAWVRFSIDDKCNMGFPGGTSGKEPACQ